MLEDLAEIVAEDRPIGADQVDLWASEAEEEREGQNTLEEVVRKAFLESLDLEERGLVVDRSRDHTGDNSSGIVVLVDVEMAVRNSAGRMRVGHEVEGLAATADRAGMRSGWPDHLARSAEAGYSLSGPRRS